MSFLKETNFSINSDNAKVISPELEKTASFSLPQGFEFNPNYLYLIVRAVSAGEYWGCNKNSDFFPEDELKRNYKTFLSAHVFKNHENKAVENAIGDVLDAKWNEEMKCVELIIRIDRSIAPSIARGFERGFMTDVSMGCRIDHSVCSICGKKAKTKFEYCEHIKFERGRVYDDGRKVFEINIAPKFHDISAVLNGAERSAKCLDLNLILENNKDSGEAENKNLISLAKSDDFKQLQKTASFQWNFNNDTGSYEYIRPLQMKKHFDKQASIQKISEIKKEIEGNILSSSAKELYEQKEQELDKYIPFFKALATKYWDDQTCKDIGLKLRDIADETKNSDTFVFSKFLKIADSLGIELSPKELYLIYKSLADEHCECFSECDKDLSQDEKTRLFDLIEQPCDKPVLSRLETPNLLSALPKIKAIMIKIKQKAPLDSDIVDAIMYKSTPKTPLTQSFSPDSQIVNVLKSLLPERSISPLYGGFLGNVKNLALLPDENKSVTIRKVYSHFKPLLAADRPDQFSKTANELDMCFAGNVWNVYEHEREKWANEENREESIYRLASEAVCGDMEKSAALKDYIQTATVAIPAAYGYSAIQRSRIRNGKRVSSINRAIAENPDMVAGGVALAAPHIIKKSRPIVKDLKNKTTTGFSTLKGKIGDTMGKFKKDKTAFEFSFLDNPDFEKSAETLFSPQKQNVMKEFLIFQKLGHGAYASQNLEKNALSEEDVEEYLQCAKKFVKMNIDKYASEKIASESDLWALDQPFLNDFVLFKTIEQAKDSFAK